MTEEEAKKCWCPFARTAYLPKARDQMPPAYNRTFSIDGGVETGSSTRCLGSQCMAWRWIEEPERIPGLGVIKSGTGYCGLAGRP